MAHTHMAPGSDVSKQEEEFVDILEERRRSCDLGHALRTFSPHPYLGAQACTTAELNRAVLESQYLRYIAREVVMETGSSAEEVRQEMGRLLEEMSQNLQLGFIRLMAYTLTKVIKRIFRNIYVNMDGLSTLQHTMQETPVILMPNHRSYVDFLVVSYLLFTYDIPVPVIAAGIPLAGMKMVGEILRRSGAFFIRRAIGSDKLYWAVLSEYVKTIIRKGFAPLEFFVEGLRSRTLKSLTPKLGMMHMVLEPFFKSEVFDITLVPVSISYDRVLEESLLAHELLGVPKPKESTTGLLKATKVLQEDYGSMHVNFGRPLSVRQLCEGKINRCQYNLTPRDLPQRPSAEVQSCVSWLAHLMVRVQEQGSVVSPWSLMASVLLQVPLTVLTEEGLPWQQLTHRTLWLRRLALDCGARLNWPAQTPDSDVMSSSLSLHRSVARLRSERVYLVQEEEEEEEEAAARRRRGRSRPEEGVLRTASAILMLAAYRNQSLHVFARPALLAAALHITASTRRDELYSFFSFLCGLFSHEFIFVPGELSQDFEEACHLLTTCGAVDACEQEVRPTDSGLDTLSFLRGLIQPFIDSYQVMFRHLCDASVHPLTEKHLLPAVRDLATRLILSGELHTYEALSSDTQKNAAAALRRLKAVAKCEAAGEFTVDKGAVARIADVLSGKIPAHMLRSSTPDARL